MQTSKIGVSGPYPSQGRTPRVVTRVIEVPNTKAFFYDVVDLTASEVNRIFCMLQCEALLLHAYACKRPRVVYLT